MNTKTLASLDRQAPGRLGTDLALAGLVVAVIVMMALPLPPWALDILVASNMSIGIVLLLVALFVQTPLAFSTFPSVLLITTLFRISLNVATTRQILLHAHAGDIITAFGRLVVGGSLVVGLVVFLIITVVQFIVIAKGAERVAEVGARFTLDALPGKQMSIDADLRAGLLSQAEALARRRELVQESQFYGAMDGAMKFVKGDAIAGIVIVLTNLIGGIAIGTLSMDLPIAAAAQRFSVLSIGDGLVTQIPALFVSIAAGVAITRTTPDAASNLGDQIRRQIAGQPRALLLGAGVMFLFAFVPGFPTVTFMVLSAAVAFMAMSLRKQAEMDLASRKEVELPAAAREGDVHAVRIIDVDAQIKSPSSFRVDLSPELASLWTIPGIDAALAVERIRWRQQLGLPFPGIGIRRIAMDRASFTVFLQDLPDAVVEMPDASVLVLSSANASQLRGPEILAPCHWSDAQAALTAREQGIEVLEGPQVMVRALTRSFQRHASAVLGVQEMKQMLRELEGRYGDLVREAQTVLPLPKLADLASTLAREAVPLIDLPALLQAIVTQGPASPDTHSLYEACRMALSRAIVARCIALGDTSLRVLALESDAESSLRSALVSRPDGPVLGLSPDNAETLQSAVAAAFDDPAMTSRSLALSADLRRACSRLLRSSMPQIAFLSNEEISNSGVKVEVLRHIGLRFSS